MVQAALAFSVSAALFLMACGGGGGGDGGGGASTIRGSVNSFSGGGSLYVPRAEPSYRLASAVADLIELLVPAAHAAVEGVLVSIAGTELQTSTADDGFFIVSGVPAGERVMLFALSDDVATLTLDVPPNAEIDLGQINISGGVATPSKIEITFFEDDDSSGSRKE